VIIDARRSRAMIRLLTVAAWLTMMGVVAIPAVGFGSRKLRPHVWSLVPPPTAQEESK